MCEKSCMHVRNDTICRSLFHQPHKPTTIRPRKSRQVLIIRDLRQHAFTLLESSLAIDDDWEHRRLRRGEDVVCIGAVPAYGSTYPATVRVVYVFVMM